MANLGEWEVQKHDSVIEVCRHSLGISTCLPPRFNLLVGAGTAVRAVQS